MKNQILELRAKGFSYKKIQEKLGCSKGTISYHCGEGQKSKARANRAKFRVNRVLSSKVQRFCSKLMRHKADDFQRERSRRDDGTKKLGKRDITFTYHDVVEKFGRHTHCYLTGRSIDLFETETYQFDHIVPPLLGGTNSLSNLGVACADANFAKGKLTKEELLKLCAEILAHHGVNPNGEETGC